MRYMCLIHYDEQKLDQLPRPEFDRLMEEGREFYESLQKSGHAVVGAALQPVACASTLRLDGGSVILTDGPFIETKEQLGGFILINARDLNEAIQIASRIPPGRLGSVEVRPLNEGS